MTLDVVTPRLEEFASMRDLDDPEVRATVLRWAEVKIRVAPPGWALLNDMANGQRWVRRRPRDTMVIITIAEHGGAWWLHLSISHPGAMPSYEEICAAKALFLGVEREAYEVHARRSKHVNIHPYCRHLWSRLDGPALPDFTKGGSTL